MKFPIFGALAGGALLGGTLVAAGFYIGRLPQPITSREVPPESVAEPAQQPATISVLNASKEPAELPPKADAPPDPNACGKWERESAWHRMPERQLDFYPHTVPGFFLAPGYPAGTDWHPVRGADRLCSLAGDSDRPFRLSLHLTPLGRPAAPPDRLPLSDELSPPADRLPTPLDFTNLKTPRTVSWDNPCQPHIGGDAVYVVTDRRTVRKFDWNLNLCWDAALTEFKEEGPAANVQVLASDKERVVVLRSSSHEPTKRRLDVLHAQTHSLLSALEFVPERTECVLGPDFSHDRFYLVGENGVRCLSLKDATVLWVAKTPGLNFRTPPTLARGGLIVVYGDRVAWLTSQGREAWSVTAPHALPVGVCLFGDVVYTLMGSGLNAALIATDLTTGARLWWTKIDTSDSLHRVVADDMSVYVHGARTTFSPIVYRIHRGTGVACWKAALPAHHDSLELPRLQPAGTAAFYVLPYDRDLNRTQVYRITGF